MMTDCPTIRLYGVDQGTDKIGHVFQQGYEYLTRYEDALAGGADEASALAGAVEYGVLTEKGLYGMLLTGVYSNGDLAGNYAGFKFYRNLFHEVKIGDRALPPILRRDGVHWTIDPDPRQHRPAEALHQRAPERDVQPVAVLLQRRAHSQPRPRSLRELVQAGAGFQRGVVSRAPRARRRPGSASPTAGTCRTTRRSRCSTASRRLRNRRPAPMRFLSTLAAGTTAALLLGARRGTAPLTRRSGADPTSRRWCAPYRPSGSKATCARSPDFGTRHSLSSADDPRRGIGAARRWIRATLDKCALDSGGRLKVEIDEFVQAPTPRMPSRDADDQRGGHARGRRSAGEGDARSSCRATTTRCAAT